MNEPVKILTMKQEDYQRYIDKSIGICIACGVKHYFCPPDTRGRTCDACHEKRVYGVPELLKVGRVNIVG